MARFPGAQFHHHFIPDVGWAADIARRRHIHVVRDARIVRDDVTELLAALQSAYDLGAAALENALGQGTVEAVPAVDSVGAKAGAELRDDGIKSLLFAIVCIMVYIAVRFDFRYGPGTVVALLHDSVLVMGAFAEAIDIRYLFVFLGLVAVSLCAYLFRLPEVREHT